MHGFATQKLFSSRSSNSRRLLHITSRARLSSRELTSRADKNKSTPGAAPVFQPAGLRCSKNVHLGQLKSHRVRAASGCLCVSLGCHRQKSRLQPRQATQHTHSPATGKEHIEQTSPHLQPQALDPNTREWRVGKKSC